PFVGTLLAFSTYFVGFAARPVGAVIFGHFGDRIGRKASLIATLVLMGVATMAIGFIPDYNSIGIWGAVLLTFARVLQGIGVGGEWGGSVLLAGEWTDPKRRGFSTSWAQFGAPAGMVLANGALALMSVWTTNEQFLDWGWRVPFLLSFILIFIGLYIRVGILETRHGSAAARQAGGDPDRALADGPADAFLSLHDLRVDLRHHGIGARPDDGVELRDDSVADFPGNYPPVRSSLRHFRAAQDHSDRMLRDDGVPVRLLLTPRHKKPFPGFSRDRPGSSASRSAIRSTSGFHLGKLCRLAALQRCVARIPACVDYRRRPGAPHRGVALSDVRHLDGNSDVRGSHRACELDLRDVPKRPDWASGFPIIQQPDSLTVAALYERRFFPESTKCRRS
ncbi:MAG: hypothetical protein DMG11_00065, partial [Acidobacteria bacterium]